MAAMKLPIFCRRSLTYALEIECEKLYPLQIAVPFFSSVGPSGFVPPSNAESCVRTLWRADMR